MSPPHPATTAAASRHAMTIGRVTAGHSIRSP
jgi:hypothetical protein